MKVTLLAVVALTAVTLAGAADPECVYRKLRSLSPHWPNPTSCNSFYRCSKGHAKLITCPTGKEYNSKNGKCSTAARGLCKLSLAAPLVEPANVCATEVNGAYLPNTDKCAEFFICDNKLAYAQKCDLGSYFDTVNANCVPDTNVQCWQNICIGKPADTQQPVEGSCSSFITCKNDIATKQQCDSGFYYEPSAAGCTKDEGNTHCWENFCIGKPLGSAVRNPLDCSGFYLCKTDGPEADSCTAGNYFNGTDCIEGDCPGESTTTTIGEETTSPAPEPCTGESPGEGLDCADNVKHGEMTTNPQDCKGYYICINGTLIADDCHPGNYFDPEVKACVIDINKVCPVNKQCTAEDKPTRGADCWHYNECVNGEWQQVACATGQFFNVDTGSCCADENGICPENKPRNSRTKRNAEGEQCCSGGIEHGTIVAHPTDCDKYQICENGAFISGTCGQGNIFDDDVGVCVSDVFNTCWICRGMANGTLLPDASKCDSYYVCNNGLATCATCPAGQWFKEDSCVVDVTAECINPCSCKTSSVAVAHPICSKYYRCLDGKAQVVDCGRGEGFNPVTGFCSTTVPCEAAKCATGANGLSLPVEGDDTIFYACWDGVATIEMCPPTYAFNATYNICLPQPSCACDQTKCAKAVSNLIFPTQNNDSSSFCICRNNEAFLKHCADGYEFDSTLNICVFTGPCDPTACKNQPDWWVTPNAEDPNSFCLCVSGVPVSVLCPVDLTYDAVLQSCVPALIPDPRCDINGCLGKVDYYTFASIMSNTGFCICEKEVPQFHECPEPKLFDPTLKMCLDPIDEGVCSEICDPKLCDIDFKPFPALNTTSGFCYCKDFVTHFVNCKNSMIYNATLGICTVSPCLSQACDPDNCLDKPEYFPYLSKNDTTGFCYCVGGLPFYHACSPGQYFSTVHGICIDVQDECVSKYCDSTKCSALPDNTAFPSLKENDDTAFCYCENGQAIFDTCKNGTVFNVDLNICTPVQAPCSVCESGKCASQEEGIPFAALNTTTGYCYCEGNFVFYESCKGGAEFNPKLGICQQKSLRNFEANNCDIFACRNRADHRPFAAKNTTDGYCVCDKARGTVNYQVCEFGQTFDAEAGQCTVEMIACDPEECLNRLQAETFAAKNTTYGFCSCDIIAVYHHCDIGFIYDSELGMCTLDLIDCDPARCNSSDSAEVFAAQNTTLGFCRCNETDGDISAFYEDCAPQKHFDAILGMCIEIENACDSSFCNARLQFKPFAALNNKTGFCSCDSISGVAFYRSCDAGKLFNANLGFCVEDSGICDSELCSYLAPHEPFAAKNLTTDGFCTCDQVTAIATYRECATGKKFDPLLRLCIDHENICDSLMCSSGVQLKSFAAINNALGYCSCDPRSGTAFYHSCDFGQTYDVSLGACLDDNGICESELCNYVKPQENFAPKNSANGFCTCDEATGIAVYHMCATGKRFDPLLRLCVEHEDICDSSLCIFGQQLRPFAAINNTFGFCSCDPNSGVAFYRNCDFGQIYNDSLGSCRQDNEMCDTELCNYVRPNENFPANNSANGFCTCDQVTGIATYSNCESRKKFDPLLRICVEHENICDSSVCIVGQQMRSFTAINNTFGYCSCDPKTGIAFYRSCDLGQSYDASLDSCLEDNGICESKLCSYVAPYENFAAKNFANGFCTCDQVNGIATYRDCGTGKKFDPFLKLCVEHENLCDSSVCNARLQNKLFAAINNKFGFCSCDLNSGVAFYRSCDVGKVYDASLASCIEDSDICESELCSYLQSHEHFAAKNLIDGFCMCDQLTGRATYRNCRAGKTFDPSAKLCILKENACDSSLCSSRLQFKPFAAVNSKFGFCSCDPSSRVAIYRSCEVGKIYDASLEMCLEDSGICASELCSSVAPYEPFAAKSLVNGFCSCDQANGIATYHNCGTGSTFDPALKLCVPTSHGIQKRSVEQPPKNLSLVCVPDEKRSVPGNCSQYEICLDAAWLRRSCPDQQYYNAEQQLCQEPRDDMVCSFARVTGLPPCTNSTESQTLAGKTDNCMQYFRCSQRRWRLRNCPKRHYYSRQMRTCVLAEGDAACGSIESSRVNRTYRCQQTAVRPAPSGCASFLMCLQNAWWYQQCPLGMYFSREHNYCMPNDAGQCADVVVLSAAQEQQLVAGQKCKREGARRASQQNCSNYFICEQAKWQMLSCAALHYFNAKLEQCEPDVNGTCVRQLACVEGQRRALLTNCTAYEQCKNGQWSPQACAASQQFDALAGQCEPSDGCCNSSGLRRACHAGELRRFPLAANCTQFYYCVADEWRVGSCLRGHTYADEVNGCVPHALNNSCQPVWQQAEHQVSDQADEVCLGQDDGQAVPHWSNCLKFFFCINEQPSQLQSCPVGSFFDAALGYCRPNDGSCNLPLSGVCAGASEGDLVAHAADCRAYYSCSSWNGTQQHYCPAGEYFHNVTAQCRVDHGQCQQSQLQQSKCAGQNHGARLAHELYCNLYYACVRGSAIPVECPSQQYFNQVLGECVNDELQQCQNGTLVNGNNTIHSCGGHQDGTYLANRSDCTRYYICSEGVAVPQRCAAGAYFDAQQLLCVPDDGSCPYVDDEQPNNQNVPPDPVVCEGQHGYMLPDPANCNNFYVCVSSKLRLERCYSNYFFNLTLRQCQQYDKATTETTPSPGEQAVDLATAVAKLSANAQQCSDTPTSFNDLCSVFGKNDSIAEQGDCRRYISCEEDQPESQRCRNGESFDSLLGICRQNDGTCLMENGERVGNCNGKHGQLARDADNCRGFFVCLHGQIIEQECAEGEYFSKTTNRCEQDTLKQCNTVGKASKTEVTRSLE